MKKLLTIATLSMLGLISCTSCRQNDLPDAVYPVTDSSAQDSSLDSGIKNDAKKEDERMHVKTEDFEFYLPSGDWELIDLSDKDPAKIIFKNQKLNNVVAFSMEEFNGTSGEFSLFVLRGLKESGSNFISSATVKVNDKSFVLLETLRGDTRVFNWILSYKEMGYVLSCGGIGSEQKKICEEIAASLIIR